ncbi:helix-turn-helix transcriptional regulator [Ornithinimicrobium sp. W1679]|uniref:helix-turn-helix transcriptional regulator n=1 Tax=Ornithinimicrobium sp. W1679 TaxID=3418770 RepID=UPI003CF5C246
MDPSTPYGRDDVLRRILEELEAPGVLLTLTGLPGSGTSTVARAALSLTAPSCDPDTPGCESDRPCTSCTVEGRVCRSAGALEAALERCSSTDVGLILVEDVHHAVDGPAVVEDLRRSRPGLSLLLTARTPVGLPGEVVVRVPPLPLPDPFDAPERLRAEPAVHLFLDRAARAGAPVDVDGADLADVARICRHVGGLPLAVELVAARAATYSPSTLLHLLRRAPGQLLRPPGRRSHPPDDGVADHDLATALAWSVALLDESARHLLFDLLVLGSSVTVDDVEQVTGRDDVVDDLAALVDVHLVEADHEGRVSRFTVAPVVRDHLRTLGTPSDELRRRHRSWARRVANECLQLDESGRLSEARRRAAAVEPDLTEALNAALADGDAPAATDLALALLPVWFARGAVPGTADRVASVLSTLGEDTSDVATETRSLVLAAWVQLLRAETASSTADVSAVVPELTRIREQARLRGDRALLGVTFVAVQAARSMVDREAAEAWAREGHSLARRLADEARLARIETWLGMLAHQRGDPVEAAEWARSAVSRAHRLDDPALALSPSGLLLSLPGPPPDGIELPDRTRLVDLARQHGDLRTLDWLEPMAAFGALGAGDLSAAVRHSMATLRRTGASGARPRAGPPLMCLFLVALRIQDLPRAGRLLGMVARHLDVLRPALPPVVAAVFDQAEEAYHAATGPEGAREVAWGAHLSHDEALDAALALARGLDGSVSERTSVGPASAGPTAAGHADAGRTAAGRPDTGHSSAGHTDVGSAALPSIAVGPRGGATPTGVEVSPTRSVRETGSTRTSDGLRTSDDTGPGSGDTELTARERQVLEALASGATNREISRLLGISPKTVMHHTSHIYRKLAVRGRAEAVAHHLRHPGTRPQTGRDISRSR